ncbi:N-acetylmuramate alpha-1-phosphate uridylyltransferase MurU [Idiomarina xiamenensis]|uniref:Nucleoside-diphosphate-sugar pyrophosphorylase n=1 Tax=Idiomarina xiamenensis 10-D-4 TaxID=740709 RepID=K2LC93_9GAMM|nr:nucleoside-diphosphate-sugar pyrophosphorylase [Idiomarina xiamenensis 10-D-4]
MILAAGRGERMRPLTDSTPKPLLPVAGKPLLAYHLEKLAKAGVQRVVINHAHLGAQIEAYVGDGSRWQLDAQFSPEPAGGLETAGGIIQALPLLGDDPFWLINGDVYCEVDFATLPSALADHDRASLLLVDNPPHHPAGDFHLQGGRITAQQGERLTYAGIGLFSADWLATERLTKCKLKPYFDEAIAEQRLAGVKFSGYWQDVGTPARLSALEAHLAAGEK